MEALRRGTRVREANSVFREGGNISDFWYKERWRFWRNRVRILESRRRSFGPFQSVHEFTFFSFCSDFPID
jgi:hypothetical protein